MADNKSYSDSGEFRIDDYDIPGSEYVMLNAFDIELDPFNVRKHYDAKAIKELATSISKSGQIQQGIVELVNGVHKCVAGNTRLIAVRYAYNHGLVDSPDYRARVTEELPEWLRLKIQLAENDYKAGFPTHKKYERLLTRYKRSLEKLCFDDSRITDAKTFDDIPESLRWNLPVSTFCKMINVSESSFLNARLYGNLNADLQRMVEEGKYSASALAPLGRIKNRNAQRQVLSRYSEDLKHEFQSLPKKLQTQIMKHQMLRITRQKVESAVKMYLDSEDFLHQKQFLFDIQTERSGIPKQLIELGKSLTTSGKLLRVLYQIGSNNPEIYNFEGEGGTLSTLISSYHQTLNDFHNEFMGYDFYKSLSLTPEPDAITDEEREKLRQKKQIMVNGIFQRVPSDLIDDNQDNIRGVKSEFNEKRQVKLARSISEIGLLQYPVLMQKGDRFIPVEGNRRNDAIHRANIDEVSAIVLPQLTDEEMEVLMFQSDKFREVDLDDRAHAIAREYELEKAHFGSSFNFGDFCDRNDDFSVTQISDAILYASMPEQVRRLYQEKLVPFNIIHDLKGLEPEEQILNAEYFALLKTTTGKKPVIGTNDGGELFAQDDIAHMREDGLKRKIVEEVRSRVESIPEAITQLKPHLKSRLANHHTTAERYQVIINNLEDIVRIL